MSNPFLDPSFLGDMEDPPGDPEQQTQGESAVAGSVSKGSNPFFGDLLGQEFPANGHQLDSFDLLDTKIEFEDGDREQNHAPHSDGMTSEDVLLDLGDDGGGGDGGGGGGVGWETQWSVAPPSGQTVDLLGSNDDQLGDSFGNIPPPMEFCDQLSPFSGSAGHSGTYSTPVTNIDDLLGLDFMGSLDPVTEEGVDAEPSANGFVLLPELLQPSKQTPVKAHRSDDGEFPEFASQIPTTLSTDPPPIPVDPPPDLPNLPTSATWLDSADDAASSSSEGETARSDVLSSSDTPTHSLPSVATDSSAADELEHAAELCADDPAGLWEQASRAAADPVSQPVSTEADPPALPPHPPPPVPPDESVSTPANDATSAEAGDRLGDKEDTTNTTTVFLPSQNPADNITQISVTSAVSERNNNHIINSNDDGDDDDDGGGSSSSTVHITDIAVTSPSSSHTSSITVTTPKPGKTPASHQRGGAASGTSAVVVVDGGSLPSATRIHFDNSTRNTLVTATLPVNAFRPTSMGVTRTLVTGGTGGGRGAQREEEEEEEDITPMTVHRDHQGNVMAAPSPPETLGRKWSGPRALDEDAKRGLQAVLSSMKDVVRASAARRQDSREEDVDVEEDEIVPVKLTRREAALAHDVLSTWMLNKAAGQSSPGGQSSSGGQSSPSGQSSTLMKKNVGKSSPLVENDGSQSSPSSPPLPTQRSGFQNLVGTVISLQTGREPLPDHCVLLTTMGVTRPATRGAPCRENGMEDNEEEEEIVPMALHKDHLGHKHYAPSPPQSRGAQWSQRQLDSAAKRDMANLLLEMTSPRVKTDVTATCSRTGREVRGDHVTEEPIVATVLSREESRVAREVMARWQRSERPPGTLATPSPFQRVVQNVMDATDETDGKEIISDDKTDGNEIISDDETDHHVDGQTGGIQNDFNSKDSCAVDRMEAVVSQTVQLAGASPPSDPQPPEEPAEETQTSSPDTRSEPSSTLNASEPTTAEKTTASELASHRSDARSNATEPPQQHATRIVIKNRTAVETKPVPTSQSAAHADSYSRATQSRTARSAAAVSKPASTSQTASADASGAIQSRTARSAAAVSKPASTSQTAGAPAEAKPQSSQTRSGGGVRVPAKIASLSQTYPSGSLSSKLGAVSKTGRPSVAPLSSSRLPPRVDYGKTRTDDSPFLVEVLKGITGLGIKVKVNAEGHVEVTEVQRNSPVHKNGNVKVGDFVLTINTTEIVGLREGRVQQVLRLLPRGLVKLVVATQPPPPLTGQGNKDSSEQGPPRPGAAYSQYGVRLSPRPFCPSAVGSSAPSSAQSLTTPTTTPTPTPATSERLSPPDVGLGVSSASLVTAVGVVGQRGKVSSSTFSSSSSSSSGNPALTSFPPRETGGQRTAAPSFTLSEEESRVILREEKEDDHSAQRASASASTSLRTRATRSRHGADTAPPVPLLGQPPSVDPSPDNTDPKPSPPLAGCPTDPGLDRGAVSAAAPAPEEPVSLSVSVHEGRVDTEGEDMTTPGLSRALSPRHRLAHGAQEEKSSPPRPAPRQRAGVSPASMPVGARQDAGRGGAEVLDAGTPQIADHPMTASEVVAAASRRPSGRDSDLPSPPSSPRHEVTRRSARDLMTSYVDPGSRPRSLRDSPLSVSTPDLREAKFELASSPWEQGVLLDDLASLPRRNPVPTPRPRSRISVDTKQNRCAEHDEGEKREEEEEAEQRGSNVRRERTADSGTIIVHAHRVTILPDSGPPPSDDPDPPPSHSSLAARPSRRFSRTDSSSKEVPSPTLVSARLRAFADPNVPTVEDQAHNRRFVSSAARMFEQKAADGSAMIPFAKPSKSSSVMSMARRINSSSSHHDDDDDSRVTMRRQSNVGGWGGGMGTWGGVGDRRKSMSSALRDSSLSVSTPDLREVNRLSASSLTLSHHDADHAHHRLNPAHGRHHDADPTHRPVNTALSPRQDRSSTTSLRSVIATSEQQSPPSVGKSSEHKRTSMHSEVTLRSRPSPTLPHDRHSVVTSQSHRKSWSPHVEDSLTPRRPLRSTAELRRAERLGSSLSYSMSSLATPPSHPRHGVDQSSGKLDSAIRRLDDLLTTSRQTPESDEELPRVSNSVNLDWNSRRAGRAAVHTTAQDQSAGTARAGKGTEEQAVGRREARGEKSLDRSAGVTSEVRMNTAERSTARTAVTRKPEDGSTTSGTELSWRSGERHVGRTDRAARTARRAEDTAESAPEKSAEQPERRTKTGQRTGRRSEVRTTEAIQTISHQSSAVSPTIAPSPALPSCGKSPDDVLVEERKSFTFSEKEIRASKTEDGATPLPAHVTQNMLTSQLTRTSNTVHESAVGYIVAQGLKGQTRQVKDREQVGVDVAATDNQQFGGIETNHSVVQTHRTSHAVAPKNEADQGTRITARDTSVIPDKHRHVVTASGKETTEKQGVYPLEDPVCAIDSEIARNLHHTDDVTSSDLAPSPSRAKQTVPRVDSASPEAVDRGARAPAEHSTEDDDDDSPPPPLPEDGPPPLPGAPPPPLPLTADVDLLVPVEVLEGLLPSQDTPPARQREDRPAAQSGDSVAATIKQQQQDEDVDADTMELGVSATSSGVIPIQPTATTRSGDPTSAVSEMEPVSFPSSQPHPTSTRPELPTEVGFPGREEAGQEENPPVSDTLSQDSGVQDEDMSEDGLRLSMDESSLNGTATFDTATSASTPDEFPASVPSDHDPAESAAGQEDSNGHAATETRGSVEAGQVKGAESGVRAVTCSVESSATEVGGIAESDLVEQSGQVSVENSTVTVHSEAHGVRTSYPRPVPSTRRTLPHAFASPVSSPCTPAPRTAQSTDVVDVDVDVPSIAAEVDPSADPQGSFSPRCSSTQAEEAGTPASPGGASTSGEEAARAADTPRALQRSSHASAEDHPPHTKPRSERSKARARDVSEEQKEETVQTETVRRRRTTDKAGTAASPTSRRQPQPQPPSSSSSTEEATVHTKLTEPVSQSRKMESIDTSAAVATATRRSRHGRPEPTEEDDDQEEDDEEEEGDHPEEEEDEDPEDCSPDSVSISCPRKWSILDQSGSLFLHGAPDIPVQVHETMLRQVSSLRPSELAEMLQTANQDLNAAKAPLSVELRLVSARELGGQPVRLDVAQREDYFVQVTRVHSKGSGLQEADLLLCVDGHVQRHRRPAMVHSQLEGTGPKGMLLTARGLKLPPSVATALLAAAGSAKEAAENSRGTSRVSGDPSASSSSPSSSSSAPQPCKAVKVGPGEYEVTLTCGPTGVGFCLEGGKGSAKGDLPILIKRIFKGGPAEKGGVLKVKDEVVKVNDVDFQAMGHYEAWNHLKALHDVNITLRIRRHEELEQGSA